MSEGVMHAPWCECGCPMVPEVVDVTSFKDDGTRYAIGWACPHRGEPSHVWRVTARQNLIRERDYWREQAEGKR